MTYVRAPQANVAGPIRDRRRARRSPVSRRRAGERRRRGPPPPGGPAAIRVGAARSVIAADCRPDRAAAGRRRDAPARPDEVQRAGDDDRPGRPRERRVEGGLEVRHRLDGRRAARPGSPDRREPPGRQARGASIAVAMTRAPRAPALRPARSTIAGDVLVGHRRRQRASRRPGRRGTAGGRRARSRARRRRPGCGPRRAGRRGRRSTGSSSRPGQRASA